jgi:DNA-binding CsgD family transcriptional regulator/PAS domain-containing protein
MRSPGLSFKNTSGSYPTVTCPEAGARRVWFMSEDQELSSLVGKILDTALDPARWTVVLADICGFVNGQACGLLSKDSVSKSGTAHYHCGVDPHYMQIYAETYFRFDPMATLPFFDVERIVCTPDLVPYDEFRQGRFYQEWVRPQGFVDAANVVLEKSATSCAYLSVIRNETAGMVDDEMRRRMHLVIPHVRRAILIGKAIDLRRYEAATFADTLGGLKAGVFLVDADGRIVHANIAGHEMLGADDFFRAGDQLVARDEQANRMLREIFAAASHGGDEIGARGIAVPLIGKDGERYVAHALPLTSGDRRRAGTAYAAAAALFVHKAALEAPSTMETMAKLYGLTPSELRVLAAVSEFGGVAAVAEVVGSSEATVKTHLQRLFAKTGTNRQTDLVKLVATHASPLRKTP